MEVLQLIVAGRRNKEISTELKVGVKSVETYRARVMKKAGCNSPAELVRFAIREGLAQA
jgi:DNA-binding NarL/FixJ family response regulator